MNKPDRKHFTVKKVKLISGGGLTCDHEIEVVIGDQTHHVSSNPSYTFNPRPILTDHLNNLKTVVAQVLGFTKFQTIVNAKDFIASPLQKEMVERVLKTITDDIRVTGISLSGEGAKEGVVITYGLKSTVGQIIGGSTPKIFFSVSTQGYEEELEKDVEAIKDEMFEYIVNDEYAQLEMGFGKDPDKKEEGAIDFKEEGEVVDAKVINK